MQFRSSVLLAICPAVLIAGCGTAPIARIDNHARATSDINQAAAAQQSAPPTVRQVPLPPPPRPVIEEKRYSVTVIDVPARDILLAWRATPGQTLTFIPALKAA